MDKFPRCLIPQYVIYPYFKDRRSWLCVLAMSRNRFGVNTHSTVAWILRNSLLEAGAESEVLVTATRLEPTTT